MNSDPHRLLATLFSQCKDLQRLAVGYSGGLDSTVLLHAAAQVAPDFQLEVHAVHVQHGRRAQETLESERTILHQLSNRLQLPLHLCNLDQEEYAFFHAQCGSEAAMRICRYRCLCSVLRDQHITDILMGHHADDQTETMLFRLITGDLFTLGGIPSRREEDGIVVHRPFLWLSRPQLREYARAHDLSWSEDLSNRETAHPRNYLRHDILPSLHRRFPSLERNIGRSAATWQELSEWMDARLPQWKQEETTLRIPSADFFSLPSSLRLHCLYRGLRRLMRQEARYYRIPAGFFVPLCTADRQAVGTLLTGRGWQFSVQGCYLVWEPCRKEGRTGYFFYCPETEIGLTISPQRSIIGSIVNGEESSFHTKGPVVIRTRWPGDSIRIGDHYFSVRRKMIRQGLAAWQRQRVPVVEDQKGIVAVLMNLFGKSPIIRTEPFAGQKADTQVNISVVWSRI